MGVIDDDRQVARAADGLQAAGSGAEAGQGDQHLLGIGAQAHGRGVDGEEVIGVVRAHEAAPCLSSVDAEEHSLEALLEDPGSMVGRALAGVGDDLGDGVLHHHGAVFVVGVDDGEGVLRQVVEEQFLAPEVLGEGLVVVQVVVGEVGEDAGGELQAGDAFLLHADGADFHEAVAAARIDHLREETVDGKRVGYSRVTVVVFPFVPVMPTSVSFRDGCP